MLLVIAWGLLLTFAVLAVAGAVALLGIRAVRRETFRRRQRRDSAIRAHIVAAIVDEGDTATDATDELKALRGAAWDHAEAAMLAMLPKVRGDVRVRLLTVLRTRGTEQRAFAQTRSGRTFVRCRGVFALGLLRSTDGVDRLITLLNDRSALVRRVAVRSLGEIGDARAVEPLLAVAARDIGLTRDVVFALRGTGPAGAQILRSKIGAWQSQYQSDDRSATLAASVLGMMHDVGALPVLADAVLRGPIPLRLAAAQALGHLASPLGLAPLQAALRAPSNQVRVAAASSLGHLGDAAAIPALVDAMRSPDSETARAAADALLEMGPAGRVALERSGAPHAVEALALNQLRNPDGK